MHKLSPTTHIINWKGLQQNRPQIRMCLLGTPAPPVTQLMPLLDGRDLTRNIYSPHQNRYFKHGWWGGRAEANIKINDKAKMKLPKCIWYLTFTAAITLLGTAVPQEGLQMFPKGTLTNRAHGVQSELWRGWNMLWKMLLVVPCYISEVIDDVFWEHWQHQVRAGCQANTLTGALLSLLKETQLLLQFWYCNQKTPKWIKKEMAWLMSSLGQMQHWCGMMQQLALMVLLHLAWDVVFKSKSEPHTPRGV